MSIKIMPLLKEKSCGDTVLIGIYQSSTLLDGVLSELS